MNKQTKMDSFFVLAVFAIATAFMLPILTYAILFRFSIYGYRTLPIAWAFAFIMATLIAYLSSLVMLRRSHKQSWHLTLINSLLILTLATGSGYFWGWHLGVPGAHTTYESLYEGWIDPENTLTGGMYGAMVGWILGSVATGWWQLYADSSYSELMSIGAGILPTVFTLGVCLSIMTTASQIVRVPFLIPIALTGVVFTLIASARYIQLYAK